MTDTLAAGSVMPRRKSGSTGHLPSLDGMRAISIALVLLGHLSGTRGFVRIDLGVGDYARLGVTVFFVISGFLITRLVIAEYEAKGHVSLKLFYARRALRLFPASYAYIACIGLLSLVGVVHVNSRDIWHAVTYTVNYLPDRSWDIAHLWSLSVEEQFYLLWPCTFVVLGLRRATWVATAVIVLGPIARIGAWLFLVGTPYRDLQMFPMVADSLAVGCLAAKLSMWLEEKNWYLELFRPAYSLGLFALILLINRYMDRTIISVFGTSVVNISIAILVHRSVYRPTDWIGKVLNWKPIAFVGLLSYSLYLWQQLFLNRYSTAWVNAFPQNVVFAVAAALASYLLLEKPLLSLRHRLRA
jgi:peptidoglycan/LPS O-acetylase OafA/YrhL